METSLSRALAAELIGTFALIFVGAGAAAQGNGGLLGAALAHGLIVVGFIYAFGHISGTHINPAVTIGLWVAQQIDAPRALAHIGAQLVGGVAGAFALAHLIGVDSGLGVTVLAAGVSPAQGLILEVILTFILVTSVLNAAVSGKAGDLAGIAIGSTLIACILIGGPLTGASFNPARTLGPAVVTGNYADIWLYFVGPILGGVIAAVLYNAVLKE